MLRIVIFTWYAFTQFSETKGFCRLSANASHNSRPAEIQVSAKGSFCTALVILFHLSFRGRSGAAKAALSEDTQTLNHSLPGKVWAPGTSRKQAPGSILVGLEGSEATGTLGRSGTSQRHSPQSGGMMEAGWEITLAPQHPPSYLWKQLREVT